MSNPVSLIQNQSIDLNALNAVYMSADNVDLSVTKLTVDTRSTVFNSPSVSVNGNLFVYGNSYVEGTVIDNVTYITTDKNLILANGATASGANDAGMLIGNSGGPYYASMLFNTTLNSLVIQPNLKVDGNVSVTNSLTANSASISGNVSAGNVNSNLNGTWATLSGNVVAGNVNSNLNGTWATLSGALTAGSASISGNVVAGNVNSNLNGTWATLSGALTAGSASISGNVVAGNLIGNVYGNFYGGNLTAGNVNITGNAVFAPLSGATTLFQITGFDLVNANINCIVNGVVGNIKFFV